MNTKQIKYVLVLAHEGSFSRAADALNISQPSLSQYIKKIEKEIGLELFDRTNGDVRITDAGGIYIEAGRKILEIEHQMESDFNDLALRKTGSLVIGTSPYRAVSMMPVIAQRFKMIHPNICLVIRERTTSELLDEMEHGEYDFALTLMPVDEKRFNVQKVAEEEVILEVPSSWKERAAKEMSNKKYPAVDPIELDGQSVVMLTNSQFMQKQLEDLLYDYKLNVEAAAVVKSLEAQIEMVKEGVGLALVPSGVERFCSDGSVTLYSINAPLKKREVVVTWQKDRKLSATAKELISTINSIKW